MSASATPAPPLQPCLCVDSVHSTSLRQQYWQVLEAAGLELSHFQQYYCLQSRGKPWWETDLGFVITNNAWNAMTACLLSNVPSSGIVAQEQELVLQSQVLVPSTTTQFNSSGDLLLEVTSLGRLAKYNHAQQVAQQASQALAQVAATAEFLGSELGITETGVLRSLSAALPGRLHPEVAPRPSASYLNLPDNNVDLSYLAVPELSDGLRQAAYQGMADSRYQRLYFTLLYSGTLGAACESSATPYFDHASAVPAADRSQYASLWSSIKVVDFAINVQPLFPLSLVYLPQDIVVHHDPIRQDTRFLSSQLPAKAVPDSKLQCETLPIRCRTYCVQYGDEEPQDATCDTAPSLPEALSQVRDRTCTSFIPLDNAMLVAPEQGQVYQIHNECVGFFLVYLDDANATTICSDNPNQSIFTSDTKYLLQLEQSSVTPDTIPWKAFSEFSFRPGNIYSETIDPYSSTLYRDSTMLVAAPLLTSTDYNSYPLCQALVGSASSASSRCEACSTEQGCNPAAPCSPSSAFSPCDSLCDQVSMFVLLYNASSMQGQDATMGLNRSIPANHILVRMNPTLTLGLRVNDELASAASRQDILFLLPLATLPSSKLTTSSDSNPDGVKNLAYEALPLPPPLIEELVDWNNVTFTNVSNGNQVKLTQANFSFTKEELGRIRLLKSTTDPVTGRMQGQLYLAPPP